MSGWRIALGFLLLGLSAVAIGVLLRSRLARRWLVSLCVGGVFLVVLGSAMARRWPGSIPAGGGAGHDKLGAPAADGAGTGGRDPGDGTGGANSRNRANAAGRAG